MKTHEMTDPAQLVEMANAFKLSRIILTANELGVFDLIPEAGISSSAVAELLNSHPRATDRFLNALVALGLLIKQGETFRNTSFGSQFLVKNSPAYLGGLSLSNQTWKTWSTLTEVLFTGSTIAMESLINDRTEEWRESFIAAMHSRAAIQAMEIAGILDLDSIVKMLDVGGGSGAFSFAMIRENPAIRSVIFDLPNIIPLTKKYILASGLTDHVSTATGNYLADDLGDGFDLVFMSAIIHINSPDENRLLIKQGTKALKQGGQLVIVDYIMNDDRTEPVPGAFFALNMLVGTLHGDTYTETEVRSWMQNAGLTEVEKKVTPSGNQLMMGKKA